MATEKDRSTDVEVILDPDPEENRFSCCGKACAVRVCVVCLSRWHKSCSDRAAQTNEVEILDESKVRCCKESSSSKANSLRLEVYHLRNELKAYKKLVKEMDDKNKLLQEKTQWLEKQAVGQPNLNSNSVNKTYADVAAPSKLKPRQPANCPTIVIKPTEDDQTGSKILNDLSRAINPANLQIGINMIKETRNGNVVIKCENARDTDRLKQKIGEKLGQKYDVGVSLLRKPAIKILGVIEKYEKEEATTELLKQNFPGEDFAQDIKTTHIQFNARRETYTIYAETSPTLFALIMDRKKINLGWQRYRVLEDLNLNRCYNCSGYGHRAAKFPEKKKSCPHCATDHDLRDCPKKTKACANCLRANAAYKTAHDTNHAATDSEACPSYQLLKKRTIARIDYSTRT